MISLSSLQTPLFALAKKAGDAILDIYEISRQYPVQQKADHSPLTQADLIAHEILSSGLRKLTPEVPILSEESYPVSWEERQKWERYWLVDPLDGTRQFLRHNGEFTVNIALIQNHVPILGLIYVPVTLEFYYASIESKGAFKFNTQGHRVPLRVHPWHEVQTVILVSKGAKEDRMEERFAHLGNYTLIKMSSAWKFCLLAEGKADISPRFGDTSEWDTAAGQCILEQAGGALLDLQGEPLRYNTKDSLINPYFIGLGDVNALKDRMPWGHWEHKKTD